MADSLTEEQQALVITQARAEGYGKAVLELLQEAPVEDALNGLITAATALIHAAYPPEQRLAKLNSKLAAHIREWAAEAGAGGATLQ